MTLPLREGDRGDRPWRVQGVQEVGPRQLLLKLLPADGQCGTASCVTPPERVVPLPPEELEFDPTDDLLDGFANLRSLRPRLGTVSYSAT